MSRELSRIELRIRRLSQLFNSLDPAPFYEQDLDADAEEFIVGWARELPREHDFELVIHLNASPAETHDWDETSSSVRQAIQQYFNNRAAQERRRFIELMRTGRFSLIVGLGFLAVCFSIANLMGNGEESSHPMLKILRESFIIVGWVALWRPLEIFLYDWWPIHRNRKLYQKLSRSNVRVLPCLE